MRADLRHYTGRMITVPWQSVLVLRHGLPLVGVVLLADDPVSRSAHGVIADFVVRYRLRAPVVATNVLAGVAELGVSIVPQIRVYGEGAEIARFRGKPSYDVLRDLFASLRP